MAAARAGLLAVALAALAAAGGAVTPTQKVLQLMEEMKAKCVAAKQDEEVQFATFKQFCDDTSAAKAELIDKTSRRIDKLEAAIMKAETDMEELQEKLGELDEDIARWGKDIQAAKDVRAKERADFEAARREYVDTLDAVDRAVMLIKEMPGKVPLSLLQRGLRPLAEAPRGEASARRRALALLQRAARQPDVELPDEMLLREAPKEYMYEGQSGGVLEMLKELRSKFSGELRDLEQEELSTRHTFESLMQRLSDQVSLAEHDHAKTSKRLAERKADKAEAEGELAEQERVKAKEEDYLRELKSLCFQKEAEYPQRQKLRAEEIEALSKAIEIMSSDSVKTKHLPGGASLLAGAPALAQLTGAQPRGPALGRVASLLRERATASGSRTLAEAAKSAAEDPFEKVRLMIKGLLTKLMEEATEEANHKGWCDSELAVNKQTRQEKAESVEELAAEAEKLEAKIASLTQDIADLGEEIEKLEKSLREATEERQKESEENAKVIADAKESQTAVASALGVLREFYAKAAAATALAQQSPLEDAPETFEGPYQGMQGESGGVVAMLEVIASDFARLEVTVTTEEEQAQAAFARFKVKAEEDTEIAQQEQQHKSSKLEASEELLASTKRSLQETQAELDAALAYYEKLKPSCVDVGVSLEERNRRREEEMLTLQEAYKILSGEEAPSYREMKAEQIDGTVGSHVD